MPVMPTQQISSNAGCGLRAICLSILVTLSLPAATSWSAPVSKFESKLKSIELCNGSDRSSPEPQIKGCTAIINSENETALVLSIAHNNRGDAYATKGDFDLAIKDYDLRSS